MHGLTVLSRDIFGNASLAIPESHQDNSPALFEVSPFSNYLKKNKKKLVNLSRTPRLDKKPD
jgi:hypothetical protein